jgi:molecular chaperone GrpE
MVKKKNEKEKSQPEKFEAVKLTSDQEFVEQPEVETIIDEKAKPTQKEKEDKTKPELSETDILKLYLEQSINEMKKAKKESDDAKKELEEAKSQVITFKEKIVSITNEYENYRRRTASEKESIYAEAICKSANALLPVLDNLERAMPFAESNPASFKQGVEMTLKQIIEGFKLLGIEEIEAHNCEFNPDFHNAVMHIEDESHDEGTVTEVFQKGFKYCDKVIRHSMVKVTN